MYRSIKSGNMCFYSKLFKTGKLEEITGICNLNMFDSNENIENE